MMKMLIIWNDFFSTRLKGLIELDINERMPIIEIRWSQEDFDPANAQPHIWSIAPKIEGMWRLYHDISFHFIVHLKRR